MEDALTIAGELVAVPSVSSMSNGPVAEVTAQCMARAGFSLERIEFVDRHGTPQVNLVGKKGPGRGGAGVFRAQRRRHRGLVEPFAQRAV